MYTLLVMAIEDVVPRILNSNEQSSFKHSGEMDLNGFNREITQLLVYFVDTEQVGHFAG